ncbi:MAG: endonuclease [Bacteroidales bacterium]|nr:endonuclease [Bacteroidales bacterium]
MNKKLLLFFVFLFSITFSFAEWDPYKGYYNNVVGKKGEDLKNALYNLIKNNTFIDYKSLWIYFPQTDNMGNDVVWDIYSDIPDGESPYVFIYTTDQCGQYFAEGDCYNREHSVPNSWFGGDKTKEQPIYTDLFHLYPTDGYVNNKRNNMPYGEVTNPTWTSQNGSKIGPNTYSSDYTKDVFEPIDAYKGDLARTYFYMSLRYKDYNFAQDPVSSYVFNYSTLKPWALEMFKKWSSQDTVSQKERDRNDAVQGIQNNRNPFIDFPQLVEYLWGDSVDVVFAPYVATEVKDYQSTKIYSVFPNPAKNQFSIANPEQSIQKVTILNELGQIVFVQENFFESILQFNTTNFKSGIYFVKIDDTRHTETSKLIIE